MRTNDTGHDATRWSKAKLLRTIRQRVNMESFGGNLPAGYVANGFPDNGNEDRDMIKEAVRDYHQETNYLIEILAQRLNVLL